MVRAKIIVDDNFRKLGGEYSRAVDKALGRAAAVTVAVGRNASSTYNIGDITASARATPARSTRKGRQVTVYWADYRALFFAYGTYARRRRKLSPRYRRTEKAAAIASEPGSGVKPQRFVTGSVRIARESLFRFLRAYMR